MPNTTKKLFCIKKHKQIKFLYHSPNYNMVNLAPPPHPQVEISLPSAQFLLTLCNSVNSASWKPSDIHKFAFAKDELELTIKTAMNRPKESANAAREEVVQKKKKDT